MVWVDGGTAVWKLTDDPGDDLHLQNMISTYPGDDLHLQNVISLIISIHLQNMISIIIPEMIYICKIC